MVRCLLLLSFLSFIVTQACSQVIILGQDTALCTGNTVDIVSPGLSSTNYTVLSNASSVSLSDDIYSPLISIGFPFTFYGNTYSDLVIGSNGVVSFDPSLAGAYCPWNITAPIPTSSYHLNSIMAPFMDMNPFNGGEILYEMIGTSPNRQFIIYYKNVFLYSCALNCWSSAIVLHETSNEIEVFLHNKPLCTTWNNGYSIEGIQNMDGTIGHPVSGRNMPDIWTVTNDGRRWTPTGPATYTIDSIAYQAFLDTNVFVHWENSLGDSFPYTDTLNATLTSNQATAFYMVVDSLQQCNIENFVSDTSWVYGGIAIGNQVQTNEGCSGSQDGSFLFDIVNGTAPYSIYWNGTPSTQQYFGNLAAGTYILEVYDNNGCSVSDTVIISGGNSLNLSLVSTSDEINGNDGSAAVSASGGSPPYLFSIGGLPQAGTTFNNLSGGQYTCVVSDLNGCTDTLVFVVNSQLSVADLTNEEVSFYPNPVVNDLLYFNGLNKYEVFILDLSGQLALKEELEGEATINLDTLDLGTYLIRIITASGNTFSSVLIKI